MRRLLIGKRPPYFDGQVGRSGNNGRFVGREDNVVDPVSVRLCRRVELGFRFRGSGARWCQVPGAYYAIPSSGIACSQLVKRVGCRVVWLAGLSRRLTELHGRYPRPGHSHPGDARQTKNDRALELCLGRFCVRSIGLKHFTCVKYCHGWEL